MIRWENGHFSYFWRINDFFYTKSAGIFPHRSLVILRHVPIKHVFMSNNAKGNSMTANNVTDQYHIHHTRHKYPSCFLPMTLWSLLKVRWVYWDTKLFYYMEIHGVIKSNFAIQAKIQGYQRPSSRPAVWVGSFVKANLHSPIEAAKWLQRGSFIPDLLP